MAITSQEFKKAYGYLPLGWGKPGVLEAEAQKLGYDPNNAPVSSSYQKTQEMPKFNPELGRQLTMLQESGYTAPNIQMPTAPGSTYTPYSKSSADFIDAAGNYINPIINNQIVQLQNALNNAITNLENQKSGIHSQAEESITAANRSSQAAKNNYNNNTLARGLGRSTIATTGLTGIDNENNRILANIEKARAEAINAVDAQKTSAQNQFENTRAGLESDRQAQIRAKADELYNQEYQRYMQEQARIADEAWKKYQADMNAYNQAIDNAYRNWQMQYQVNQDKQEQDNWERKFSAEREDSAFDKSIKQQQVDIQRFNASKQPSSKDSAPKINIGGTEYDYPTTSGGMSRLQALDDLMNDRDNTKIEENGVMRKLYPIEKIRILEDQLIKMSAYQGGEWDTIKAAYREAIKDIQKYMKQDEEWYR